MVVLFSAGNAGIDIDNNPGHVDPFSLSAQAVAKNTITVGASESERPGVVYPPMGGGGPARYGTYWPGAFPSNPIKPDDVANNREGMAAFSSRGPTKPDGRIKPDVVAPGTTILSARSSVVEKVHFKEDWGHSTDDKWMYEGGTSMATPLTAGVCAVIRGALIETRRSTTPSASLVKAILINGAVMLKGQYNQVLPNGEFGDSNDAPNYHSGFGRVNTRHSLQHVVPEPSKGVIADFGDITDKALTQGAEHTFTITIPQSAATNPPPLTLKVTLVWTDRAGGHLQQDLDLTVTGPGGVEKHGNMGDDSTKFDRINNVEQVKWKDAQPGVYTGKVKGFRVPWEPVPFAYAWRVAPSVLS